MSKSNESLRTPLSRVRGLGSAKRGVDHFIAQRVSAIALAPLAIWFVWAIVAHAGASYAETVGFLSHPVNAALMLLFAVTGIYHFMVGLQVVIEDYVHGEGMKIAALLLNKFACAALALACVIAILKLAL